MITLSFDCHDFISAVEGFAYGSHLRQHVWENYVFRSIPQMSDEDMDLIWFILRRNLWDCYFYEIKGKIQTHVGHEDYLHALAALHRGNRYKIKFRPPGKGLHTAICYRHDGKFRPLYVGNSKDKLENFNAYIPDEWVKVYEKLPMPDNRNVEQGKEEWWNNIDVYNNIIQL